MYNCIKITVIVFNLLFLVFGLGVLGIGIWVRIDKTQFDPLLGETLMPIATYIMTAVGGTVVFIALLGCYGAVKESQTFLGIYSASLVVIFFLQSAAAVVGFMFYDQVRAYLDEYVGNVVINKYSAPGYQLVTTAVDAMHIEFECCGYNSPYDWGNSTSYNNSIAVVPTSCCKNPNEPNCNNDVDFSKIHEQGCVDSLVNWLGTNFKALGGTALSVALVQLSGIVCSLCLCIKAGEDDAGFV